MKLALFAIFLITVGLGHWVTRATGRLWEPALAVSSVGGLVTYVALEIDKGKSH